MGTFFNKHHSYLVLSFFYLLPCSYAENLESFLREVSTQSRNIKIIEQQNFLGQLRAQIFDFTPSSYLSSDFKSDRPATNSVLSSTRIEKYSVGAGIEKLWQNGLSTSLDYDVSDNSLQFPTSGNTHYFSPHLSATLSTDLLRDFLPQRYQLKVERTQGIKQQENLIASIEKKKILVSALLSLAQILETKDELELQQSLCADISSQSLKLGQKYQRGSIAKREFLLSQKDLTTCQAAIKTLEKNSFEFAQSLSATANINVSAFLNLRIETIFKEITSLFAQQISSPEEVNLAQKSELALLHSQRAILSKNEKELEALANTGLDLSLTMGLTGQESNLRKANEELTTGAHPYIALTAKIDLPFSNSSAQYQHSIKKTEINIIEKKISQLHSEIKNRFDVLKNSLGKDYGIIKDFERNVALSQQILSEARRDFNNGRIDFFALTEFQKGLTQSRKLLAGLRTQIIIKTVEYIDHFNYFNKYY